MRLFRSHHAAQADHQILVGKPMGPAQRALVLRGPLVSEAGDIDTVVDHRVLPGMQPVHVPVSGLCLADEDQEIGPAHHMAVQHHVPRVLA